MSNSAKGNKLEDMFYEYLLEQQVCGDLIFGTFSSSACKIYKKRKYYCHEREAHVEFDVVIEVFREGGTSPILYVVFECKNHDRNIDEDRITPFSDKIGRLFPHANKGVLVVSSPLQSGAEAVAKKRKMGIVKFSGQGFEVVADRTGRSCIESKIVKSQFFRNVVDQKPLKFVAYHDGRFFGSLNQFLQNLDPDWCDTIGRVSDTNGLAIPYVSVGSIRDVVEELLDKAEYRSGPIDLEKLCSLLSIELIYSNEIELDSNKNQVLGTANFGRRSIVINPHQSKARERFTIAHEIGHFCLDHERFLRSETIVANDLLFDKEEKVETQIQRLEFQANTFASELLLPESVFLIKVAEYRKLYGIRDRGHGYIYVDDQPCNFNPYGQLMAELSSFFEVSRQAIEIRLIKLGMLNDQRNGVENMLISNAVLSSLNPNHR